jgi:hypothetical protein
MSNHIEPSVCFTLRPNKKCHTSQKQPTVQNLKKNVHNKIFISLTHKTLFSNVPPMSRTHKYF